MTKYKQRNGEKLQEVRVKGLNTSFSEASRVCALSAGGHFGPTSTGVDIADRLEASTEA